MSNHASATDDVSRRALWVSVVATCLGVTALQIYERRLIAEISGGDPVAVLTLLRDVPEGAPLGRDALGVRSVPEAYLERRQVREVDVDKIVGLKLALGLRATESLLWTDLAAGRLEARDLSALVQPGSRAVTVEASTFEGLLRPGDRVDVLPSAPPVLAWLFQNLLVVAVGGDTRGESSGAASPGKHTAVTLTGTIEQAAAIADAARDGDVVLSLRNPDDLAVDPSTMSAASRAPGKPRGPEIEHVR